MERDAATIGFDDAIKRHEELAEMNMDAPAEDQEARVAAQNTAQLAKLEAYLSGVSRG